MTISYRIAGGTLRPTLGFSLFVVFGVMFLLGLGGWQLQRMAWKHDLVARITAQMSGTPLDLPSTITDPAALEYKRVRVSGVFHHDKEFFLAARELQYSTYGAQILTPLETDDHQFVLVSRGWVPNDKKPVATRAAGQVAGRVTITGVVRLPKGRGWMVPDNAPQRNFWLWVDLPAMAQSAAVPRFVPLLIEADATPNEGGFPVGGQTRVSFTDNHFVYAITWFCLAFALVVIGLVKFWERDKQAS